MDTVLEQQKQSGRLDDAGDFPNVILVDTVSFCNLRCSMCFHKDMARQRGYMPWSLYTRIIDEIADENPHARVWLVFFGEALIRRHLEPTIFDQIRYAKERGLADVVLNSNANLLDTTTARRLIDSGLDALYIGIDAATAETYSRVRVGGDYQRVVANVSSLLRLQEESGAEKPTVFVQFVEMDENAHEKEAFIEQWKDRGAQVKIRPKVSWAGKVHAPNLVLGQQQRWPCYWAMQSMSITDQGDVVTCAVDLDARYVAGNVNQHTLKEIWTTELRRLRQLHLDHDWEALPEICRDCGDWQSARADFY